MTAALQEERLRLRGRRVRLLRGGSGPPLLLCHGFLGSAENFDAWLGALLPRRTLVIPDLPGCGASDPLPGAHTAAAIAASLAELVDALELGGFDLGGLCLGAPVACALARRRPAAVGRLLLHTPLLAASLVRRRYHLQVRALTAPGIFDLCVFASRRRLVSDLYKRLLVEGPGVDPVAAQANFDNQVRAHPRASREWLRDGLGCDDRALLGARRAPSLLVAAAADRIVDVARLGRLAAGWPQVELVIDATAGHAWSAASVHRQLAAIAGFLDRPEGEPAA